MTDKVVYFDARYISGSLFGVHSGSQKDEEAICKRFDTSGRKDVPTIANRFCHGFKAIHPETLQESYLSSVIISLNDRFGWSREKIADWLDTLEVQPVWNLGDALNDNL